MDENNPPPQQPGDDSPNEAGLRELVGHSLLAGVCPLVPIPFLDDWLRDLVRRHQVRRLAAAAGRELDPRHVEVLACGHDPVTASGCVEGCLRSTVLWPARFLFRLVFKKILRKLVVVLAVKDSVDTFSAVFHEAYLVRHALARPPLAGLLGEDFRRTVEVRRAIEAVRDEVDPRPVERLALKAFRGSRRLLSSSARRAARLFRRRREDMSDDEAYQAFRATEDPGLDAVTRELTEELRAERGYLLDLEARLEARLERGDTKPHADVRPPT